MSIICEYCGNSFKQKKNLVKHQKTAVFCLKIRSEKDVKQKEIKYQNEIAVLSVKLQERDKIIKELKDDIKTLQNKLENIALQSVKRPNNVTNTTNNIVSLQPLTSDWLNSQALFLTREHIEKGISGYAEFAKNYSLKDRVKCVDFSRKNFQFINGDGETVKDNRGNRICKLFFDSIKTQNETLVNIIKEDILERVAHTSSPLETNILLNMMTDIINISRGIKKVSEGENHDIRENFSRELCNLLER